MKILFVLENMSKNCGANVNIALTIASRLKRQNHELLAVTKVDETHGMCEEKSGCFQHVTTFFNNEYERLDRFYQKVDWEKKSRFEKMGVLCIHPFILSSWMDIKLFNCYFLRRKYRKVVEGVCKKYGVDVVIAVVAPYYLAQSLKSAKIKSKKALYQLDPYAYNETFDKTKTADREKVELQTIKKMDIVFVTKLIYNQIKEKENIEREKLVVCEFPGIVKREIRKSIEMSSLSEGKINLVFVGTLYPEIRNPKFLLDLMVELPEKFVLHIVGGGADDILEEYKIKLGDRLCCHGWLDSDSAYHLMYQADVLVNINNSVRNQLASKLFDYISTGKPILNICKLKDCPSLEYTERYDYCLTIFEGRIEKKQIDEIQQFVEKYRKKKCSFSEIEKLFKENTDQYVADLMIETIQSLDP
ncbi:MAG: glycosyltransferase [Clostridiales bacterium]|nr:glycosyltransferase [Clostridiales bacterium]